ncbi:loganic acid O-methyltransferase-like [Rhodamnia argentea]|uniref:Loganic acid O-methyltransferase-like n=1 Tax=Rhodamnia argentea TaxID=178133 RepID=A0A8B8P3I3_9MYRT|nr:loganic acid O-methyltransferase-like [Rhodamnia argentea]
MVNRPDKRLGVREGRSTMEEDSLAMNGGDGPNSYSQNCKYQVAFFPPHMFPGAASDQTKLLLMHSIEEKLMIPPANAAWQVFRIADLGCSVGPNTFTSMQTIIDTINLAYVNASLGSDQIPEFQVFFNDQTINDFNTPFRALPPNRPYMGAGVSGSFHGRLFPAASMNLMHSAFALPWLTKVPEEVKKVSSHAWNGGRIPYAGSSHRVAEAFAS